MPGAVPQVRIMIPPKGMVQLWAWIQCVDDDAWWACVGWTAPHDDHLVLCTGYASPDVPRKKHTEDYRGTTEQDHRPLGHRPLGHRRHRWSATTGGPDRTTTMDASTTAHSPRQLRLSSGYG